MLRRNRHQALRYGLRAEFLSAIFLMLKGWKIMAFRHRNSFGEVDIIAFRQELVIFVEVKARSNVKDALNAVSYLSQERIRSAGKAWLATHKDFHAFSYRCDIIAVIPWNLPKHFPDAF
ncbi:putative endonuclease protein [Liberibacter crescens BT-1]|uniref:UPF0102 protein B488_00920 n=1 Tax=Liberibacter crescens (strain BT-1) TaxID=1215343 RepID=L0ETD8_LIBCB|nr:YraN family protein [Liberibacter crescens]AGA64085.1 putative endonuclease protein [Liberibacter crescens BT-1]AMC12373.1 endonuclease [Liberibacter crescens]